MTGPFGPRKQISTSKLNQSFEQSRRLARATGAAGVGVRNTPSGAAFYDPRKPGFFAIITDKFDQGGGNPIAYAIKEQQNDEAGLWIDATDGIETTTHWFPSFEPEGIELEVGDLVWAEPSASSESYIITKSGSGSGSGVTTEQLRVIGPAVTDLGVEYYPTKKRTYGPDIQGGWTETSGTTIEALLIQCRGIDLTVGTPENPDSGGIYTGKKRSQKTVMIGQTQYTLDVYSTTEFPAVTNVTCNPFTVTISN